MSDPYKDQRWKDILDRHDHMKRKNPEIAIPTPKQEMFMAPKNVTIGTFNYVEGFSE